MTDRETMIGCVSGIPEYDGNPLIRALPPILGASQIFSELSRIPEFNEMERKLPSAIRSHIVHLRLKSAFFPTSDQVIFAEKLDLLVRSSYVGRNIADGSYLRRIIELADNYESKVPIRQGPPCARGDGALLRVLV